MSTKIIEIDQNPAQQTKDCPKDLHMFRDNSNGTISWCPHPNSELRNYDGYQLRTTENLISPMRYEHRT